jgi:hypothetical protein
LPAHIAETSTTTTSSTSAPANTATTHNQSDNHLNDESQQLNWENGLVSNATVSVVFVLATSSYALNNSIFSWRFCSIVPANNATCGNKSKTEDTLSSNGISNDDVEESSQYPKFVASTSFQAQNSARSGSSADVVSLVKKTQVFISFFFLSFIFCNSEELIDFLEYE